MHTSPAHDLQFVWDDGGRLRAGYSYPANDCAARAVAIATQFPYQWAHDRIDQLARLERRRVFGSRSSAENGVHMETMHRLLGGDLGWAWHGALTNVTLMQLPTERMVVRVGRHYTAITDGAIHDTINLVRSSRRVVGYWSETN